MKARLPRPAICLVTPGTLGSDEVAAADKLVRLVGRAVKAGVNVVQVRERQLADRALYRLTLRILGEVDRARALVVVNERADISLSAGADGVHLRADGAAAARLRTMVPDRFLVGRSVHGVDEAVAVAEAGGVDYLMFGTVFESHSKPENHPIAGSERLREVCASTAVPVIAIGGITENRLAEVAATGAVGFAAISAFLEDDGAGLVTAEKLVQRAQREFHAEIWNKGSDRL